MSVTGTAVIQNEAGIHCRPSAHIIKSMAGSPCELRIQHDEEESDLSSMLSLMMLALACGTEVQVEASGPGEAEELAKLIGLLETHYDFPPKEDS